ncbi:hypothetical protein D018_0901B, partial [Vibrio parahaemolyticus VP2007-007]
HRIAQ